jgi:hypothetical protein
LGAEENEVDINRSDAAGIEELPRGSNRQIRSQFPLISDVPGMDTGLFSYLGYLPVRIQSG